MRINVGLKFEKKGNLKLEKKEIENMMYLAGLIAEGRIKELCTVDLGFLRASVYTEMKKYNTVVIGSDLIYALPIEYGTKPHFVSPEYLKGWAGRVLGDENAAYAVAKKIERKGTRAHPFMRPGLFQSKSKIQAFIKSEIMKKMIK